MEGEWRHETFEGVREGCDRDARHEDSERSILVRFEGFERGLCYRRGRDVMYTPRCKRSLEVRPFENRADCKSK